MPLYTNVEAVRKQAPHYLSPQVASTACMTVQQMQQFIAHMYVPTPEQIHALALSMHLYPDPAVGQPTAPAPTRRSRWGPRAQYLALVFR